MLKRMKDLEVPKGKKKTPIDNSFAALDNEDLMRKARIAGVILGTSVEDVGKNIEHIKDVEVERLENFHESHPDMFLPSNLDVSVDNLSEESTPRKRAASQNEYHISDTPPYESAWIEVTDKRSGRAKKLHI